MADKSSFLGYDFIRFTWSDIHGIQRGKLIPAARAAQFFKEGLRVATGMLLKGPRSQLYTSKDEFTIDGNDVARPIPDTLRLLQGTEQPKDGATSYRQWRVGSVLCEIFAGDTGLPMKTCTRQIARQQLQKLHDEFGYALKSGQEHEFIILDSDSKQVLDRGEDNCTHGVHVRYEHLLYTICDNLAKFGIELESFHAEYGYMLELATIPMIGIEMADASFMLKQMVKEVCIQEGYIATFMSCPMENLPYGSSTHFNLSLLDSDGNNVFRDDTNDNKMSSVFRQWCAGILAHASALTAICRPTVNCYRRFGVFADPLRADWGMDNRNCYLRVKGYGCYLENRIPSSASNPYLVMAGTVAAGMDGLRRNLELPEEIASDAQKLPGTLREALKALQEDQVMREALGECFVKWFAESKMEIEIKGFELGEDDMLQKEREMYLEVV